MQKRAGFLTVLSLAITLSTSASAAIVIDFDDLIGDITVPGGPLAANGNGNETYSLPYGYQGFMWNSYPQLTANWAQGNMAVVYQQVFIGDPFTGFGAGGGYGNNYGFPTPYMAAMSGQNPEAVALTSGGTFSFLGAYFSSWLGSNRFDWYSAQSITVAGYRGDHFQDLYYGAPTFVGGSLVASVTVPLTTTGFVWVDGAAAGLTNIDKLVITVPGAGGTGWVMDNFTVQLGAVPLPATLVLFASGLAVMRKRLGHALTLS